MFLLNFQANTIFLFLLVKDRFPSDTAMISHKLRQPFEMENKKKKGGKFSLVSTICTTLFRMLSLLTQTDERTFVILPQHFTAYKCERITRKKRKLHSRLLLIIRLFKDGRLLLLWPLLIQKLMLTMMTKGGDGHIDDDADDRSPLIVSQPRKRPSSHSYLDPKTII